MTAELVFTIFMLVAEVRRLLLLPSYADRIRKLKQRPLHLWESVSLSSLLNSLECLTPEEQSIQLEHLFQRLSNALSLTITGYIVSPRPNVGILLKVQGLDLCLGHYSQVASTSS
jgi:hypothetical protein